MGRWAGWGFDVKLFPLCGLGSGGNEGDGELAWVVVFVSVRDVGWSGFLT